jgi:hypothetical protein
VVGWSLQFSKPNHTGAAGIYPVHTANPVTRRVEMSRTLAAVVVAALLVTGCTGQGVSTAPPGSSLTPPPSAVPSSSPIPSPSPATVVLHAGTLAPGTYFIGDRCCVGPKGLYLTVPAGWETGDPIFVGQWDQRSTTLQPRWRRREDRAHRRPET